jgi:hypothetical protein
LKGRIEDFDRPRCLYAKGANTARSFFIGMPGQFGNSLEIHTVQKHHDEVTGKGMPGIV